MSAADTLKFEREAQSTWMTVCTQIKHFSGFSAPEADENAYYTLRASQELLACEPAHRK